jgi:hypothetical protein
MVLRIAPTRCSASSHAVVGNSLTEFVERIRGFEHGREIRAFNQTAPTPAAPELEDGVEVEVIVTSDGVLSLVWPSGQSVAVPLTRPDAMQLAIALVEYCNPGERLRATQAAGNA